MLHRYVICVMKRIKHPFLKFSRTYSKPKTKQVGSDLAISHFDQFYSTVYKNWPSIRLALLCPHHYCAVANSFCDDKTPQYLFSDLDVFNMRNAYNLNLTESPDVQEEHEEEYDPWKQESIIRPEVYAENVRLEKEMEECGLVSNDQDEYMPATQLINREFDSEECDEFYTPNVQYDVKLIRHGVIHFPEHLDIYYWPRGKFKRFKAPKEDVSGLLNYYLMDGASILPVLALDVQKNEDVGDLCASPGGKTLAILFTLRFRQLVCNDVSASRVRKLKTVLSTYLPATEEWSKKVLVSNLDVRDWRCFNAFDKILLDVPCTNDRLSVTKDANNIFAQKRYVERMQLPKIQTNMLLTALQALKPGGSLVYSTCSLSPIQNDGVVHMALSKLSVERPDLDFFVNDLTDAFFPLRKMFQFSDPCRYGQLIIPFLPLNFGPMYISKITRNK